MGQDHSGLGDVIFFHRLSGHHGVWWLAGRSVWGQEGAGCWCAVVVVIHNDHTARCECRFARFAYRPHCDGHGRSCDLSLHLQPCWSLDACRRTFSIYRPHQQRYSDGHHVCTTGDPNYCRAIRLAMGVLFVWYRRLSLVACMAAASGLRSGRTSVSDRDRARRDCCWSAR